MKITIIGTGNVARILCRLAGPAGHTIVQIVGRDPGSDLAVLKIEAKNLPVVKLGSTQDLRVGEWVLAIGSPFGFENSVSAGVISAKGRSLGPDESRVPFLQTDVAINPGNSGGPLFNARGEVVGINSQIYSRTGGYMGLSFAIPIDLAVHVKTATKIIPEGAAGTSLHESVGMPGAGDGLTTVDLRRLARRVQRMPSFSGNDLAPADAVRHPLRRVRARRL